MIKYDSHMHTYYSPDSDSPMKDMVEKAIDIGLEEIILTDHFDYIYPDKYFTHQIDYDKYVLEFEEIKKKYSDKINIAFGIEIGLSDKNGKLLKELIEKYKFDFVIGSVHDIKGIDLYTQDYFIGKEKEDAYKYYFEYMLKSIKNTEHICVIGHFDYVSRYGPYDDPSIKYADYKNEIDIVLKELVKRDIGLEINTSGYRYGLGDVYPQKEILTRYKELGGKIITFGSDAHRPENIGNNFDDGYKRAKEAGFEEFAVYRNLQPTFRKLD